MGRAAAAIFVGVLLVATAATAADAPRRAQGISMHMLPKRIADIDGRRWGLVVTHATHLKHETIQPVLQSAAEVLSYTRKQDVRVQENGLWIVTSHPDAYTEMEKKVLDDVKAVCRKERIPLFTTRAALLPNGWQRHGDPR